MCYRAAVLGSVLRVCGQESGVWWGVCLLYSLLYRIGFGQEYHHDHCHEIALGSLWFCGNHPGRRHILGFVYSCAYWPGFFD